MRIHLMMKRLVLLSCVLSISAWATPPAHAADPLVEGAMVLAPIGAMDAVASGAVEDTLKACLARIPEIASVGQRTLAEQGCAGEDEARKAFRSAAKF